MKTSRTRFVSPGTRLGESESKATYRPSALIQGRKLKLVGLLPVESEVEPERRGDAGRRGPSPGRPDQRDSEGGGQEEDPGGPSPGARTPGQASPGGSVVLRSCTSLSRIVLSGSAVASHNGPDRLGGAGAGSVTKGAVVNW